MGASKRQFHEMREAQHEEELIRERDLPEWFYESITNTKPPKAKVLPENINVILEDDALDD